MQKNFWGWFKFDCKNAVVNIVIKPLGQKKILYFQLSNLFGVAESEETNGKIKSNI